jgi:hypothetical protein
MRRAQLLHLSLTNLVHQHAKARYYCHVQEFVLTIAALGNRGDVG